MARNRKGLTAGVIVIGIMLCVLIVGYFLRSFTKKDLRSDRNIVSDTEDTQSDQIFPDDLLPKNIVIGKQIPDALFQMSDGSSVHIDELVSLSSEGVWLSFPGENAEDSETPAEIRALCEAENISVFRVVQNVPKNYAMPYLIDPQGACLSEWGVDSLPSDVILDHRGKVLGYHAGPFKPGEAKGMLKRVRSGRTSVNFAFIERVMSDGNGGFYTNTAAKGDSPSGKDVLSESQGLVMMYALTANNPELFSKTWIFTKEHLLSHGLAAWYVSEDGKQANVNAFLDDVRIWFALYRAGTIFDVTYAKEAEEMLKAIKSRCLDKKRRPVDFSYLSGSEQADVISLHYLDLEAMQAMKEADPDFETAYNSAVNILQDGRISDEFPLYYRNYDYTTRSYDPGSLNTAEALYTLWHLSRAGLLPDEALDWLKERVMAGSLAARYKTNGDVVPGYDYHSTAVYALAALIAREAGDDELFEMALRRMERKLILDADDELFGAYSQKGAVIYSFDQLMPLLVNALLDRDLTAEETADGKQ